MVIALCGRSGSGKSAVSAALEKKGAYVIDADKIGKNIMSGKVLEKVRKCFPDCFSGGVLVRTKLAAKVFSDGAELKALNGITHPEIRKKIENEIRVKSEKFDIIIVDAAVLIEAKMTDIADFTVAVTAPDVIRKERITARDGLTEKQAEARLSAQMADDYYIKNTDYSVVNDGKTPLSVLADNILERSAEFAKGKRSV